MKRLDELTIKDCLYVVELEKISEIAIEEISYKKDNNQIVIRPKSGSKCIGTTESSEVRTEYKQVYYSCYEAAKEAQKEMIKNRLVKLRVAIDLALKEYNDFIIKNNLDSII